MSDEQNLGVLVGILVLVIFVVSVGFVILKPYYEAKAFNDCTGGNATYFTAVFTQLRVDNCN